MSLGIWYSRSTGLIRRILWPDRDEEIAAHDAHAHPGEGLLVLDDSYRSVPLEQLSVAAQQAVDDFLDAQDDADGAARGETPPQITLRKAQKQQQRTTRHDRCAVIENGVVIAVICADPTCGDAANVGAKQLIKHPTVFVGALYDSATKQFDLTPPEKRNPKPNGNPNPSGQGAGHALDAFNMNPQP